MEPPAQHGVLVTGASRGIGAAIARRLAREGASVLIAARDAQACAELAAEIEADGGTAHASWLDVTDPAGIRAAVAEGRERLGDVPLDWLVNNAGIAESAPLVAREGDNEELCARLMDVNYHGARRVLEAVLPDMRERKYGRVVNVASSAGLYGYAYVSAYCASKFALVGYTLAAAEELEATGVTVNAVCPWYVDSPMLEESVRRLVEKTGRTTKEARAFFREENPGGELVTEEEVAEAVLELLAGEQNGALVELEGGS